MKKLYKVLVSTLFITTFGFATTINVPADQTTIQAGIDAANATDTVLVAAGTYSITSTTNVFEGITLKLDPNVNIECDENGKFNIAGKLIAIGNENNLIKFYGVSGVDWDGIQFLDTSPEPIFDTNGNYLSGNIFKYCKIENIKNYTSSTNYSAIYFDGSSAFFSNCHFNNINHNGNQVLKAELDEGDTLRIIDSKFTNCSVNRYLSATRLKIKNCDFINNSMSNIFIESILDIDNILVLDNSFNTGNSSFLMYSGNSSGIAKNSKFVNNTWNYYNLVDLTNYPERYFMLDHCMFIGNSIQHENGNVITLSAYDELVTLQNCTFYNNELFNNAGLIKVNGSNAPVTIVSNNFINTSTDNVLSIEISTSVNAENNYWGVVTSGGIENLIYHYNDDITLGQVDYDPWLLTPSTTAPPIPAQNTTVTGTGNDFISLKWDASLIGDLAGYKLYYDSDSSGYPYANSVDIGTDTSYTLSGLQLGTTYYLAVTTYDTDGNESWYSNEVSGVTRVMQAQSLDIGEDEDLQHLITHTPAITFGYYDSMNETQTNYQVQVSTQSDYSSIDMWDSGEITSSDTSVAYAGTTLADGATYYLRAKVGAGSFYSNWSTLTFRMNTEPTTPVVVSPINDQVSGTPVVLKVLNATDTESDGITYSFNVYSDVSLTTKLDSSTAVTEGIDTTGWQVTATLPDNGQYFWTVSTNDGYEESIVSTAASFLLNISNDAPAAFALLSPADSAEVTTLTPLLDWASASDPDPIDTVGYTFYLDTPDPGVTIVSVDTATSYQVSTSLSDNTTYYWKVVANDLNGSSTENTGGYHSFRVNTANDLPGDFALLSPEDSSIVTDLMPTFHWEEPVDPDDRSRSIVSYYVYLDTASSLIGVIPDTVTTNSYTPTVNLLEDAMYYWKIEAVDDDGGMNTSVIWSFSVNTSNSPPSAFALLSPAPDSVNTTQVMYFEWESATDSDPMDSVTYGLDVHADTTHMHYDLNTTSFTSNGLTDNSIYHWSVTAYDMNSGTTENTGGPRMFVINVENDAPTAPVLVAPLNESIQTDLTPNFYWTESIDPDPLDHVSYIMSWWGTGDMDVQTIDTDSNGVTPETILMDNSVWEWMVTANDMHNSQSSSDTSYFYSDAFPEPPLNFATVSPENNAEGIATEVEFVWEETYDPDPVEEISYRVVYAPNWEDSSTYVYSETIQDTSMVITLVDNTQYYWLVEALDSDGFIVGSNNNTSNVIVVGTLAIDGDLIPVEFALHQNYPNPFNPLTTLRYDLPEHSYVNVTVYDMLGREIKSLVSTAQEAGFKSVTWNATNDYGKPVSAGVYLYQIQAGEFVQTKKMVLLK